MAKRGRKRKTERKGYFYEVQEQAVVDYIKSTNDAERNEIFTTILQPALTKMIESIIRRYKLYPPDEDYQTTFDDTLSFLITKIKKFNPESGYKAYSYCGTICKNYLIYKINQYNKNLKRNTPYDLTADVIEDNNKYSYTEKSTIDTDFITEVINKTCQEINDIIQEKEKNKLTDNELKVGNALICLLTNWENIFNEIGSNKFNKSSILLFLKESTLLNTKEIRDSMKKFKTAYFLTKKNIINS